MKNSTFSLFCKELKTKTYFLLAIISMISTSNMLVAQCTLSCEGEIQVSLDMDCQAEITAVMMLSDDGAACFDAAGVLIPLTDPGWEVIVSDAYGVIPTSPIVTGEYVDQTLTVTVISPTGNSCWGYALIEDKLGPEVVYCPDAADQPILLSCAAFNMLEVPEFADACEGEVPAILLSEEITTANCETYVKEITRTYYAVDSHGRASEECTVVYRLTRIDLEAVQCPYNYLVSENTHLNCDGSWNVDQCHQENFEGDLDPSLWDPLAFSGPGGGTDGVLDVSGAPDFIEISGTTDGTARTDTDTDLCIDITCGGTMTFDWSITNRRADGTMGIFLNDEVATVINGVELFFSGLDQSLSDQTGTSMVAVVPGDQFCFRVKSNNIAGITTLTLTNITLWGLNGIVFDEDTNGDGVNDTESNGNWDEEDSNGVTNGYPDVGEVAVPTLNGVPIYPTPDFYCNVGVFFSDIELPKIGCTEKIMRVWSIREWHCGMEFEENCTQIIEIYDHIPPVIESCENLTLTTNTTIQPTTTVEYGVTSCGVQLKLPLPNATDNCTDLHYDLTYPGGFISDYDGEEYFEIPMGTNELTFTVYDECYNSSQCTVTIEVVDDTPPVTICDQYTVVALTNDGIAHAYAEVFDDGSYDDCKMHCMLVRRMDDHDCPCEIPQFCDLDYVGEHEGHHYYLSNYEKSSTIAKARANAYGGSLAIFDTDDEEDWVVDEIRTRYNGNFWIGGERRHGGFGWCDGTDFDYTNWEVDRPYVDQGLILDYTSNPTVGNTILVADGAQIDGAFDMVSDLTIAPGTEANCIDITWNWFPEDCCYTTDDGINMKLLYNDGTGWVTIFTEAYTGVNTTNTIAPFLDIVQSGSYSNFKISENSPCGTHYFRIAIEDNAFAGDVIEGDFGTGAMGSHYDNADVAFEVTQSADCYGDCVYVNANDNWEDAACHQKARYLLEIDDICGLSSFAQFCCSDVGEEKMVLFRSIDAYGNFNDCMVSVDVQDKLIPQIACPPDVTINCTEVVDLLNMAPEFGEAYVTNNCEATMVENVIRDLGQCNTGRIIRTFIATNGSDVVDSCHQYITLENTDPFDEDDIIWPDCDTTVYGCLDPLDFGPDVMGYPILNGNECDLVGANYEDQVFYFTQGTDGETCSKILRLWTVIDWCQYYIDPITGDKTYHTWPKIQVIKIGNNVAPVVETCEDLWICNYDPDCGPIEVTLTATAADDCTDELSWIANIDVDNDGDFDHVIEGWGPFEEGTKLNTASVTREFENGHHSVFWTFLDNCGNITTCSYDFIISSCKAATPYCINGLAVDLMPIDSDNDGIFDTGMVQLWASDFDAGSYHPCGDEVLLSFSEDVEDTFMDFDCSHANMDVPITIYTSIRGAHDGEYIQAYCETYVNVQDNNNACSGVGTAGTPARISGNIMTEMNEAIDKVEVALLGSDEDAEMTDNIGGYAFGEMPFGGNYVVDPKRDDNHLNGVSTLDLVLIQRHILGLEDLDSPYKIIAGDINNDDGLSSIDLIELRKLILGIYMEYPESNSWRFVNSDYEFTNAAQPLSEEFEEAYSITGLNNDMTIDFTGLKVGDVNYSAELNLTGSPSVDTRSLESFDLEIRETIEYTDNQIALPIYASAKTELYGMQFTIQVDANLSFNSVLSNQVEMQENNLGLGIRDQRVSLSWNDPQATQVNSDEPLFTLILDRNTDAIIVEPININSSITDAEAYTDLKTVKTPKLVYRDLTDGANRFELYQNMPNPFSSTTEIKFILPSATDASLTITDITGKVIKVVTGHFAQGMNSIVLSSQDFDVSGFLYYTLKTTDNKATRKMVLVK